LSRYECIVAYAEESSDLNRQDELDLTEEARDLAASRSAVYQRDLRLYHSRGVRGHSFVEGSLVMRFVVGLNNGGNYLIDIHDRFKKVTRKHKHMETEEEPKTWNIKWLGSFRSYYLCNTINMRPMK
jgi:hypothetical protein